MADPQPGEIWVPKRHTRNGAAEFKVSEVRDGIVRGHLWFPGKRREIRFTRCALRGFLMRYRPRERHENADHHLH